MKTQEFVTGSMVRGPLPGLAAGRCGHVVSHGLPGCAEQVEIRGRAEGEAIPDAADVVPTQAATRAQVAMN